MALAGYSESGKLVPGRIRGYRAWSIGRILRRPRDYSLPIFKPQGDLLCSIGVNYVWDSKEVTAECNGMLTGITRKRLHIGNESIASACSCGIYACHTMDHLFKMVESTWNESVVVGVIEADGTVFAGTNGFRAEHARIVALSVGVYPRLVQAAESLQVSNVYNPTPFFSAPYETFSGYIPTHPHTIIEVKSTGVNFVQVVYVDPYRHQGMTVREVVGYAFNEVRNTNHLAPENWETPMEWNGFMEMRSFHQVRPDFSRGVLSQARVAEGLQRKYDVPVFMNPDDMLKAYPPIPVGELLKEEKDEHR